MPSDQQDSRWFLQQADESFFDASDPGSLNTAFGWGTSAADYDNDGDTDILYHGGLEVFGFVLTAPGVILEGDGAGGFSRATAPLADSIDHRRRTVHGMAVGDLDQNGFVDIVSVSNFDIPDSVALVPAPSLPGDFDVDAVFVPTVDPVDGGVRFKEDLLFTDGTLSVELSSGANGNGWIQVETLGSIGLIVDGKVNRSGIGAVVGVTPFQGKTAMQPVLGGSSYASQDSLVLGFGLGSRSFGRIDVLLPGGVRNRLYAVDSGSRVRFPEIPCSFDDPDLSAIGHALCVGRALVGLKDQGVLSNQQAVRFFVSALLAFADAR